jgi:hypothetical protein
VGSSPTQPIVYFDGVGIHSPRVNRAALYRLDDQLREATLRASQRGHAHNPAIGLASGNCRCAGTRNNRTSSGPRAKTKAQEEPKAGDRHASKSSPALGSSLVEQPRKLSGLVVGSSPTQPKYLIRTRNSAEPLRKPFGRRWCTVQ